MLVSTFRDTFLSLYLTVSATLVGRIAASVVIFPLCVLLGFRLWAFTIKPLFRPEEPKELPYWVPYLGHAIEYVKNGQGLITRGREYFNDTREPFALTLGGEKLYFITSPTQASALYKNTETMVFEKIVHDLTVTFGVSKGTMDNVFRSPSNEYDDPAAASMNIKNPQLKSLAQLNNDFWKQQLVPGPIYHQLQDDFASLIAKAMDPATIPNSCIDSKSPNGSTTTVSLLKWSQMVLLDAAIRVFFGSKILETEPNFIQDFLDFDEDNWQLWYKWPQADAMYAAKGRLAKSIQRYLALSDDERSDASFIVKTMIKTQRAIGTSDEDISNVLCMVLWVTNTNTWKVLFWALSYLLHSPHLLTTICTETASARSASQTPNGTLDKHLYLQTLMDNCPHLAGLFHESLRLCSSSSSIRLVTSPTHLGGKLFPTGSRVVIPFRQLHLDPSVYGTDPNTFDPERWIRNKKLASGPSYRPFGGGVSYCPGRFIARQEVTVFIALLLERFDVRVAEGQRFPVLDDKKPTTGLMSPKDGEDLLIRLRWKADDDGDDEEERKSLQ